MAAGALFFDEQDHVLLVEPTYKDYREIPGGYVEAGESPRRTCIREVREELGIDVEVGPLLVVDWAPNQGEGDKVLYVFDGGRLSPEQIQRIRLQASELKGYAFHSASQLEALTIARLARRLQQAVQARDVGRVLYLEHGAEVPGR